MTNVRIPVTVPVGAPTRVPAVAATALALATCLTAAGAAGAATAAPGGLHASRPVGLGNHVNRYGQVAAEAPDGAVFYGSGSVVRVVDGNRRPAVAEHAGGQVIALAASRSALYVETGGTVTSYSRSSGRRSHVWRLPAASRANTAALRIVGRTLFAETVYETDQSGLEYGDLDRVDTRTGAVKRLLAEQVLVGAVATDATSFFGQAVRSRSGDRPYLFRVRASGGVAFSPRPAGSPVTDDSAGVVTVQNTSDGTADRYVTYHPGSLRPAARSRRLSPYTALAETRAGLLAIPQTSFCPEPGCAKAVVEAVRSPGGAVTAAVKVPGAWTILDAAHPAVLTYRQGRWSLLRLSPA